MTAVKVKCVTVNNYSLVNIRLLCYGLAYLHLLVTAYVTLSIDLTIEESPKVRVYSWVKWNLITCWFNCVSLVYIPLCMYCDWREKRGDETPQTEQLRQIRDVIMAGISFPVTVFSDLLFWILYKWYPWIIAPTRVLELVPWWAQHSLHTVSFAFVIMDLVLTPRQRPKSDKTNLAVLYGVALVYILVMYVNYKHGFMLYAFLYTASRTVCILAVIISFLLVTLFYHAQWHIVDYIWGNKAGTLRTESVKLS